MQKKDIITYLIIGIISSLLFAFPPNFANKVDDFVSTWFYILNKKTPKTNKIVIVKIDESTLEEIAQQWPMSRAVHAKALNVLNEEHAKVVGFDIVFHGKSSSSEDDTIFAKAIEDFRGDVVLGYYINQKRKPIYPLNKFRKNALLGIINIQADKHRVLRYGRAYFTIGNTADFHWSIKVISSYYSTKPIYNQNFLKIAGKTIPINKKDGTILINYLYKPNDFKTISFKDLINKNFPAGLFKNKIVLISPTLKLAHDIHATPLDKMPGTFAQANIIANILTNKVLEPIAYIKNAAILLLLLVFLGIVSNFFPLMQRIIISLGCLLILFWITLVFKFYGWQIDFGNITIAFLGFTFISNIYIYIKFQLSINKLKNKMTKDPLTHLCHLRYFIERAQIETKNLSKRRDYLIIIKLEGLDYISKGENIERLKCIWKEIFEFLLPISNLWGKYDEEVILGRLKNLKEMKKIKNSLDVVFYEKNLNVTIKIAGLKISNTNIRNITTFILKKMDEASQNLVIFNEKDFPLHVKKANKNIDVISSLFDDAEIKNRELLETLRRVKVEEKKTQEAYLQLISSLVNALESKDPYTKGHTKRVCDYSLILARKMDLSDQEIDKIKKAALLHDLGKIAIPDEILHKKGRLSDDEFNIIKSHTIMSSTIMAPIEDFKEIIPYVVHHHESFDGSGYPHGLAGDFIPVGSRIIAIADVFDALTTGRSYKKAFTVEATVEELIRIKGIKFDPILVDKFIEALKDAKILSVSFLPPKREIID